VADVAMYVMTPEFGAASQLEKIDMIDYADLIAINKFDKRGSLDAIRDVRKQFQRSRQSWDAQPESMPVYGTIASQFNDAGVNALYSALIGRFNALEQSEQAFNIGIRTTITQKKSIIPADRNRYLAEITEESKRYEKMVEEQSTIARSLFQVKGTMDLIAKKQS
jgi:methylmalonyl-CoA mutase